jgi:hypothetical protein
VCLGIGKKYVRNISHLTRVKIVIHVATVKTVLRRVVYKVVIVVDACKCTHKPKCLKQCGDVRCRICIYDPTDAYSNE